MCGICGIAFSTQSRMRVHLSSLERMRDTMAHRGPDGAGTFIEENVGLAHRRLSIVDVVRGAQPMASADGRFQLVYNGEVYNHPDLSAMLRAKGVEYATSCDTETVLHMCAIHGVRAPEHLRGMFAFAFWDKHKRELLLARDRFGVKPLYYSVSDDGSLFFASEIKALLASGCIRPELNLASLPDFLANHAPSGEDTLFAGIRRLPAGHTLSWRDGVVEIRQYWDLHFASLGATDCRGSEKQMVAAFRERLYEAVRLRLMADVPLGVFLSGGIDSAAITAAMHAHVGEGIGSFSVAFAEREANELHYARLVAERFKTVHHEIIVSPSDFFSAIPRLVWHEDEPPAHPSSIALNFVARLAAEHVKVVLTGEGSDETLGGYGRYPRTLYQLKLARWYESSTSAASRQGLRRALTSAAVPYSIRRRASRTFLLRTSDIDSLYFDNFAVFPRDQQLALLHPSLREQLSIDSAYGVMRAHHMRSDASTELDRLLYTDIKTYLHELLMKQDQMSMAASIESRVPFLDHPLVEFTATLPNQMKLRRTRTKYILRKAMDGVLPREILDRPKMGFPVPIGRWLRGPFRRVVEEFVMSERARSRAIFDSNHVEQMVRAHDRGEDRSEQLWALITFETWQRLFFDAQSPESITSELTSPSPKCLPAKSSPPSRSQPAYA